MATGGGISLLPLFIPTLKTAYYLLLMQGKVAYSQFSTEIHNFRCHDNKGRSEQRLAVTLK